MLSAVNGFPLELSSRALSPDVGARRRSSALAPDQHRAWAPCTAGALLSEQEAEIDKAAETMAEDTLAPGGVEPEITLDLEAGAEQP